MASLTREQKAKMRELMQQQKSRFEAILTALPFSLSFSQ
jgi:Spy/CpxP family protein refolding chaperone